MKDKVIDIKIEKVTNGFHITVETLSDLGMKQTVKFVAQTEKDLEMFLANYAKGLVQS